MKTTIAPVRISQELEAKLASLPWAKSRSDAIRTIAEAFVLLSEVEQAEFLRKALSRKFGTHLVQNHID